MTSSSGPATTPSSPTGSSPPASRFAGRRLINFAGCESAGFDDGVASPRRLFTGASQEVEKGYERPDWKLSVYTGLMVDHGLLQRQGDADGDGAVSIQEAFNHTAAVAPEMTATQRYGPQHPYIAGGDGPEWFLSPPPEPEPAGTPDESNALLDDLLGDPLGDLLG
jgi:hypothetical protein